MDCFASCAPGLEKVLAHEAAELNLPGVGEVEGGIEFTGGWSELMRANLHLRSAGRVLVRIAAFPAVSLPEFDRKLKKVPWEQWLNPAHPLAASVASRKSKLNHTTKLANILLERAGAHLGDTGGAQSETTLHLRFHRDVATLSLDTSGPHLHKRGYRTLAGLAPIRETLAAGCLLALGYTGSEPLLDPMCGSGTFPVEAALIARNIAPGISRAFALESFPGFDASIAKDAREKAREAEKNAAPSPIFGSDHDPRAVELALASAKAAGVENDITITRADLRKLEPPAPKGLLVANPPYGVRLGGRAYAHLAEALSGPFASWRWGVVECRKPHTGRLNLQGDAPLEFTGGGLPLKLVTGGG